MIAPHLRLQPGQQALTPAQEAEAKRFAEAYIQAQLSTEPVDEPQAEAVLRQAYAAAGVGPPQHIHWLDGPLQLVALLAPFSVESSVWGSVWDVGNRIDTIVRESLKKSVRASVDTGVVYSVGTTVRESLWESVRASVRDSLSESVRARFDPGAVNMNVVGATTRAYCDAFWLPFYQFFVVYLAPNALHALAPNALAHFHALADFSARVSAYWLGQDTALLVRRPAVLARDIQGRLHSATGKCIEYHDGWGFYAWHGVRVPERVFLAPEALTREDFLNAENVEMRRVIQERMGSRFIAELGGVVLDVGSRGTLYEVALPQDPERVARYVQVQDSSTERHYYLRVPPTITSADEAIAWTFGLSASDYRPGQET